MIKDEIIKEVENIRRTWKESDDNRDKDQRQPESVLAFRDIAYGSDPKWNLLDVYRRKDAKGAQPTIVNMHGGGFVYGTKETYQFYCMSLAERGFTVVSYNYRLAPESPFPAAVEDSNAVMVWMCNNAEEYQIDLNNVFIVGDSAGACLAAQYAAIWANPDYAKLFPFEVPKIRIGAVCLNCGTYLTSDDFEPHGVTQAYYGENPMEKHGDRLRMHKYLDGRYPPAIVMSSEEDFLLPSAKPFAELLTKKGASAKYSYYEDKDVKLQHVFHVDQRLKAAHRCNDEQVEFFREHIK